MGLKLRLDNRGGKRAGAGRPRLVARPGLEGPGVAHLRRHRFPARHPVHVTQTLRPGTGFLRSYSRAKAITDALQAASERKGFRVIHYSIQSNHLHLIIEASEARTLATGVQSFSVRLARALNRLANRRGAVFVDRYHSRALGTPREVRNALEYLHTNYLHHGGRLARGDPYATSTRAPLLAPRLWLLREGWQRADGPAPPRSPKPTAQLELSARR